MCITMSTKIDRRQLAIAAMLSLLFCTPLAWGSRFSLGGGFTAQPEDLDTRLSPAARDLLTRALSDIGVEPLEDYHAHIIGIGTSNTHAEVNASSLTWWHPINLRMMAVDRYRGLLFADISATTQVNRTPRPILELIRRPELHDRLVNGSDYPIPAINCVIWLGKLTRLGLITSQERQCLNEIYDCNPLLFDYALKRTVRDPVTGKQLPAKVFLNNPGI